VSLTPPPYISGLGALFAIPLAGFPPAELFGAEEDDDALTVDLFVRDGPFNHASLGLDIVDLLRPVIPDLYTQTPSRLGHTPSLLEFLSGRPRLERNWQYWLFHRSSYILRGWPGNPKVGAESLFLAKTLVSSADIPVFLASRKLLNQHVV
jgi:hypothetical protein